MQVHEGLLSGTPQLSEPERTALCWNSFLPRPVLHRPPAHSPASSPCPPETLAVTPALVKALARRLPKRPRPHPLESPSVQVRFGCGKKEYGKVCMATAPRTIPSPNAPGDCILSLWTGQGGGFEIQRRAGDLILGNSATVFGGVMCH
ncbi:unnamed protein product [Pipistrellus nathusii]|uniref:Uncharacterized protein n=1 Tax=Pipistrellus nathusii TaxID=59473 RepID=A0ABP0A2R4_PIPNA